MRQKFLIPFLLAALVGIFHNSFGALPVQGTNPPVGDQILCGGTLFTDTRDFKILVGHITGPSGTGSATFRANGASSGYQIPVGRQLQCLGMKIMEDTAPTGGFNISAIGDATNDVGQDSATGPTGTNVVLGTVFPPTAVGATGTFDEAIAVTFSRANAYPYFTASCGTCTYSIVMCCYERNNP